MNASYFGIPGDKIEHGVDLDWFPPDGTERQSFLGTVHRLSVHRLVFIDCQTKYVLMQMTNKQESVKLDGESAVLGKIAAMPDPYRAMGERLHAIIKAIAPALSPKVWYGMPGYAKDGKVVCFFRSGEKFKERYMTLGFNDNANLDDGNMWPIAFALTELTPDEEARIAALVKKAVK
jgi:uncharacterized protein YdhG (YjbR/CyaY superfamily)